MFQIHCPWCGERSETEFRYGGEAHIARPEKPDELSDAEWGRVRTLMSPPAANAAEERARAAQAIGLLEALVAEDAEWGDFLFMRTNPKGWHRERWMHSAGCRRWFNAIRNTHTNEFHTTYKIGEKPALPGEEEV